MKLTRRNLLGGLALIGASAAGGAGTFAYLQDNEGTDVTINVGTLSISNDPVEFEFAEDSNTQGEDSFGQTITIVNDGTLPVRQVLLDSITADNTILAESLLITDIRYGRETNPENRTSIIQDVGATYLEGISMVDGTTEDGIYLQTLIDYLQGSNVRLEELIDDSEEGDGEVLYVGEEAYLDIVSRWDYSKIPTSGDSSETNSTDGESVSYNGSALSGTITIRGKQQEA